jgi:hypothetical protein
MHSRRPSCVCVWEGVVDLYNYRSSLLIIEPCLQRKAAGPHYLYQHAIIIPSMKAAEQMLDS